MRAKPDWKSPGKPLSPRRYMRGFILFALLLVIVLAEAYPAKGPTCGVDALYQICLRYNLAIRYEEVYAACKPTKAGNTMLDLLKAANHLGFSVVGVKATYDDLLNLDMPCIAFVSGNHFVAILEAEKDRAKVGDYPNEPSYWSREELENTWNGELLALSWQQRTAAQSTVEGVPRIHFEQIHQDFGVVPQGERVRRDYLFRNDGTDTLVIQDVRSSCGSTAFILSATEIIPGATGAISIAFDTSYRKGRQTHYAGVMSNDPATPVVRLTLSGEVSVEMAWSPRRIFFGRVRREDTVEKEVIFSASQESDFVITGLDSASPDIALSTRSFRNPYGNDGVTRVALRVLLQPKTKNLGVFNSQIMVSSTNIRRPLIDIPVSWVAAGDLSAQPEQAYFGIIGSSEKTKLSITITGPPDYPFEILGVEHGIDELEVRYSPSRREGRHLLEVAYDASRGNRIGVVSGTVTVFTDYDDGDKLEIPVLALVQDRVENQHSN